MTKNFKLGFIRKAFLLATSLGLTVLAIAIMVVAGGLSFEVAFCKLKADLQSPVLPLLIFQLCLFINDLMVELVHRKLISDRWEFTELVIYHGEGGGPPAPRSEKLWGLHPMVFMFLLFMLAVTLFSKTGTAAACVGL